MQCDIYIICTTFKLLNHEKFLIWAMLLAPAVAIAAEATFQCFLACGKVYYVDADIPTEQIVEWILAEEANCSSIVVTP